MQRRKVASDVAGTVWRIEAPVGSRVEAEDTILLLECMKMEIPVYAPSAGTVAVIRVVEGEAVAEGQIVAELES
jgi:biotin carboxyl carrier protein